MIIMMTKFLIQAKKHFHMTKRLTKIIIISRLNRMLNRNNGNNDDNNNDDGDKRQGKDLKKKHD